MSNESKNQNQSCHDTKQSWPLHTVCFVLLGLGGAAFLAAKYFNWNISGLSFLLPAVFCIGSHVVMMKMMGGHGHDSKK